MTPIVFLLTVVLPWQAYWKRWEQRRPSREK
jgi:hypothetical protein